MDEPGISAGKCGIVKRRYDRIQCSPAVTKMTSPRVEIHKRNLISSTYVRATDIVLIFFSQKNYRVVAVVNCNAMADEYT